MKVRMKGNEEVRKNSYNENNPKVKCKFNDGNKHNSYYDNMFSRLYKKLDELLSSVDQDTHGVFCNRFIDRAKISLESSVSYYSSNDDFIDFIYTILNQIKSCDDKFSIDDIRYMEKYFYMSFSEVEFCLEKIFNAIYVISNPMRSIRYRKVLDDYSLFLYDVNYIKNTRKKVKEAKFIIEEKLDILGYKYLVDIEDLNDFIDREFYYVYTVADLITDVAEEGTVRHNGNIKNYITIAREEEENDD